MMINWCEACRGAKITGWIPRWEWLVEEIRWSYPSLLKYVVKDINCKACGGDGYAKPPGWPDREAMNRLRPWPLPPMTTPVVNGLWFDPPTTEPPSLPPRHAGCDEPRGVLKPIPPKTHLIREGCFKPIQE